jgi:hypothetical protein
MGATDKKFEDFVEFAHKYLKVQTQAGATKPFVIKAKPPLAIRRWWSSPLPPRTF